MMKRLILALSLITSLAVTGVLAVHAQEPAANQEVQNQRAEAAAVVDHADCMMFSPQRERYANQALHALRLGQLTGQVSAARAAAMGYATPLTTSPEAMPSAPGGSRTYASSSTSSNLIDGYIFAALKAQGVTPANATNDYEFIRRITLDMTGRIPTAAAVQSFVANTSPTKRADVIEQLFAAPQWLDKWTMYFGDQFKAAKDSYAQSFKDIATCTRSFLRAEFHSSLVVQCAVNGGVAGGCTYSRKVTVCARADQATNFSFNTHLMGGTLPST